MRVKLLVLSLAAIAFILFLGAFIEYISLRKGAVAIFIFIGLYILARGIKFLWETRPRV